MTINIALKEGVDCCDDGPYKTVPAATNKRAASLADNQAKRVFEIRLNHLTFQKFPSFFPTLKQQNFLPYNTFLLKCYLHVKQIIKFLFAIS